MGKKWIFVEKRINSSASGWQADSGAAGVNRPHCPPKLGGSKRLTSNKWLHYSIVVAQTCGAYWNDAITAAMAEAEIMAPVSDSGEDASNNAIAAAMAEAEIMAPDSGGEGTTPEQGPTVASAQSRSNAGEVLKMQRQIAELEARLAEKESKVTDDL